MYLGLFYRPLLTPLWAWGGQPGRRLARPYSGFCLLKNHYSATTKTFELGIEIFFKFLLYWVNAFYLERYLSISTTYMYKFLSIQ